jgi:hypothetical protein
MQRTLMDDVYKQLKKILIPVIVTEFSLLDMEIQCTSVKTPEFNQS